MDRKRKTTSYVFGVFFFLLVFSLKTDSVGNSTKKTRETSEQIRTKMGTSDWFYFPDAPSWGHQNFLELYMDVVIFGALKRSS